MIDRVIEPHLVPLVGDLTVRRVLPRGGKGVGPFFFLDHFGPWQNDPGSTQLDVPPHPHIGLSTLTYLFEGETLHRDSLGSKQAILPGEVNWMTAGRGVVHSERVPEHRRQERFTSHGLQAWVGLPESQESREPSFSHHGTQEVPRWSEGGVDYALLAGEAMGRRSPVAVYSPLFYLLVESKRAARVQFAPLAEQECGFYLMEGTLSAEGQRHAGPTLLVFKPGQPVEFQIESAARGVFLGGDPIGARHMVWNFMSSSREKIAQARDDWEAGRMASVPGDPERIPFPESKRSPI